MIKKITNETELKIILKSIKACLLEQKVDYSESLENEINFLQNKVDDYVSSKSNTRTINMEITNCGMCPFYDGQFNECFKSNIKFDKIPSKIIPDDCVLDKTKIL